MTTGQIVGVCSGIGLIVIIFSIILVAMWRSREVKFFLFHYLNWNTKPKDDRKEILDGILYDAYFCYWFVSFSVSLWLFMSYLWGVSMLICKLQQPHNC